MFFYKQLFTPQQLRHLPWFYDFMNSFFKTLYNCAKFTSVYLMQYVWICNSHYSDQIKWHENVFWQWYLSRFLWSQRIFFRITILTLRPIRLPKRLLPCQKIANPGSLFFLRKKTWNLSKQGLSSQVFCAFFVNWSNIATKTLVFWD